MDSLHLNNFESAGRAVLDFLHQRFGFALWMITRTEEDDWIVLQAEDHGYQIKPGQVFRWADSFCSRMVQGLAPRIAPRSEEIELYAKAEIAQQVDIKAYMGQPLFKQDGKLFGTLCAIDPHPQPEALKQEQNLLELLGAMLSSILQNELKQNEQARHFERLEAESLTDELTQLYNRRGWERLLTAEEDRSRRHGNSSIVYAIDLDGLKTVNDTQGHSAGDELIKQAAIALKQATRQEDIVARLVVVMSLRFSVLRQTNQRQTCYYNALKKH